MTDVEHTQLRSMVIALLVFGFTAFGYIQNIDWIIYLVAGMFSLTLTIFVVSFFAVFFSKASCDAAVTAYAPHRKMTVYRIMGMFIGAGTTILAFSYGMQLESLFIMISTGVGFFVSYLYTLMLHSMTR